jgi:hypothetical protein
MNQANLLARRTWYLGPGRLPLTRGPLGAKARQGKAFAPLKSDLGDTGPRRHPASANGHLRGTCATGPGIRPMPIGTASRGYSCAAIRSPGACAATLQSEKRRRRPGPSRAGTVSLGAFLTRAFPPARRCLAELQIHFDRFISEDNDPPLDRRLGGRRPGATDGSVPIRRRTAVAVPGLVVRPSSTPGGLQRCPSTLIPGSEA